MISTFSVDLPLTAPADVPALRGRLTVADKSTTPSLFILPGSGLSDGDGNDSDIGFRPLAQLAEALAEAGFNSLRFDLRGTGETGGDYVSPERGLEDFTAVLQAAQTIPELPKPWVLLGLGEAAAWAGLLATQEPVDGLVLISPPTGPVSDIFRFRQQADGVLEIAPPENHRAILQQQLVDYEAKTPLFMFQPIFRINCPTLVLHGDMDWVCPVVCSRLLVSEVAKRGQGPQDLTYRELPGLDRWLIATDRWRSLSEQLQPHWQIDSGAVEILVNWLRQKFPA